VSKLFESPSLEGVGACLTGSRMVSRQNPLQVIRKGSWLRMVVGVAGATPAPSQVAPLPCRRHTDSHRALPCGVSTVQAERLAAEKVLQHLIKLEHQVLAWASRPRSTDDVSGRTLTGGGVMSGRTPFEPSRFASSGLHGPHHRPPPPRFAVERRRVRFCTVDVPPPRCYYDGSAFLLVQHSCKHT
jgi:hypothetical protein